MIANLVGWLVFLGIIGTLMGKASHDIASPRWLESIAPVKGKWLARLVLLLALLLIAALTLPLVMVVRE